MLQTALTAPHLVLLLAGTDPVKRVWWNDRVQITPAQTKGVDVAGMIKIINQNDMLTLVLFLAALICFAIFFKSIDFFDKI
jgi:hypothetical protein